MTVLNRIDHIVVLMLENRSFDSMLGMLYPKSDVFDGLSGNETNPDHDGNLIKVWSKSGSQAESMTIPNPDPGELWTDMNMQIFNIDGIPGPSSTPVMQGFVRNYQNQHQTSSAYAPNNVMHYYLPEQVPILSQLARQFAVSDRWHASAPCQTWPNRFFVHTGTANGYENNSPTHFPYEMPTIFNRFENLNIKNGWKIYFHDVPQTLTLSKLWLHISGFRFYDEFRHDAKYGTLPNYSFIEPRYFPDVNLPNDQHPTHNVTLGEQLIADVYNCLRNSPVWTKTLLIITYDEHGGSFDHVPPPSATPPGKPSQPFNFDRYGVRVPAVMVSPYIRQGTIIRPSGNIPFDHTSILATLRKRFNLGPPLSNRDAVAPDLASVLNLTAPDNSGPAHLDALPYITSPGELALAKAIPLNGLQKSLLNLSKLLPRDARDIEGHITKLKLEALQNIKQADAIASEVVEDVSTAVASARNRLGKLFSGIESK